MTSWYERNGSIVSTRYSTFDYEYTVKQGFDGNVVLWVWMTMYELDTIGL